MKNLINLFNCIYYLGFGLGWAYWDLNNKMAKDLSMVDRWIERLELEAHMYEAEECNKIAAFMKKWIEQLKQSKEEYKNGKINISDKTTLP